MNPVSYDLRTLRRLIQKGTTYLEEFPPVVGISCNHDHVDEVRLTDTYAKSVMNAGGIPFILPKVTAPDEAVTLVSKCDALILSGGGDFHPLWTHEETKQKLGQIDSEKDLYDLSITLAALRLSVPILAICRGLQGLNIALGGNLYEDITSQVDGTIGHQQTASKFETWHRVQVTGEGRLREILGNVETLEVNSFHHQAVRQLPSCATVCATSSDGIIEAVDFYPEYNALGVQWHPESLASKGLPPHTKLFDFIVKEAELRQRTKQIHHNWITIDSHTDTPTLLFEKEEEIDILQPSEELCVDYPKMCDGMVDLATMVAWIPQKPLNEDSRLEAYKLAVGKLESTRNTTSKANGKLTIYTQAEDGFDAEITRQKGILLGVENGFAIGRDLQKLSALQELGTHYITLCHNGDNDICDSAVRSNETHHGLSTFGKEVIQEMNRLGITIDISHASDKTIEDVLEISNQPIIASHSACRALYNHPRNLPDHLISEIVNQNGVIQICMYGGFLRANSSEATVLDFCDHMMHAYELTGPNHLGIGSDFDGDGGVIGCRHMGMFHRITTELLRRGLLEKDLGQILGTNFLEILASNYHNRNKR